MRQRIESRHGHFAGEDILAGQFRDLEEPRNALLLDVWRSPQQLAAEAIAGLHLSQSPL
jgi:gluconate kinase